MRILQRISKRMKMKFKLKKLVELMSMTNYFIYSQEKKNQMKRMMIKRHSQVKERKIIKQ